MSQTAPPSDKAGKPAASSLVPPDERFWQRYSPHAEFPLSSAGSFVVHILVFGLLLLASFLGSLWFHTNTPVKIEGVQLGGGGNPHGQGEGRNTGEPVEAGNQPENRPQETIPPEDVQAPPKLDVNPDTPSKPKFDDKSRRIQKNDEASNVFQSLNKRAMQIQTPGSKQSSGSGYGKGGTGSGGGSGSGTGRGAGSGNSEGKGNLTERQKRQLRWDIQFGYVNATDYVAQLKGLGAVLALPVGEKGNDFDYRIVRDLSARPAKLLKEDPNEVLREINGMMPYFDKNPKNARDVFYVLRVPLPKFAPDKLHFVAFMPEKLEQKLLRLENDYLRKHHAGRSEEDIESTTFRLKKARNGQYDLEVTEQILK
jgi:hypothetical protein